jgi:hypothetical protein
VEDHAAHRHLRSQLLEQVPSDRLAFPVLVRRQQELVRVLELPLQIRDDPLLVGVDDVVRLEAVVDRDPERAVFGPFVLRDLGGALGQVADVTDAGFDHESRPQVAGDGLRLGRGFDDHERLRHRDTLAPTSEDARPPKGIGDAFVTRSLPSRHVPTTVYTVAGLLSWPLMRGLFRLHWTGVENVPEGGSVLAANHNSNFDPWPLGFPLWPRRQLYFMVRPSSSTLC